MCEEFQTSFNHFLAPIMPPLPPPPHDTHLQLLSDGVCYPLEQVNCTLVTTQVHLSCWDAEDGLGPGTPAIIVLDHLDFIYHSYVDYSVCVCVCVGGGGEHEGRIASRSRTPDWLVFFFYFIFAHMYPLCAAVRTLPCMLGGRRESLCLRWRTAAPRL